MTLSKSQPETVVFGALTDTPEMARDTPSFDAPKPSAET